MQQSVYTFLSRFLSPGKIELFERIVNNRTRQVVLVAEDIYQSQNTSSMLRSAECYGVQDVYVIENNHSFNVKRRIAKGAAQWLTLHRYCDAMHNSKKCMQDLREKGYRIVATSPHHNALPIDEISLEQKTAIVIGTELTGVSEEILSDADEKVFIPMYGFTESLNASVATAIALYQLRKQLSCSNIQWQLSEEEKLELKIVWAKQAVQSGKKLLEMFEAGELK
ncbi:MAG: RNA methyltransferase [Flavobacteriales bacterium]|nr:RNA methyltransferase [Flavobacteriales bacterium]